MVIQNPDMTFSADIDGHNYKFTTYDADKGFRVLCEVSALLGAGLAEGKGPDVATSVAAAVCSGLGKDGDRSLRLVKRLCCDGVEVDGQRLTEQFFLIHFARRMPSLFKVVSAAIEVQFGNFFDLLKSSMGGLDVADLLRPPATKT